MQLCGNWKLFQSTHLSEAGRWMRQTGKIVWVTCPGKLNLLNFCFKRLIWETHLSGLVLTLSVQWNFQVLFFLLLSQRQWITHLSSPAGCASPEIPLSDRLHICSAGGSFDRCTDYQCVTALGAAEGICSAIHKVSLRQLQPHFFKHSLCPLLLWRKPNL